MNRLPDFIIIGAMKCATSTLHEQLARQPGFFMSDPKEPNFFSDDEEWRCGIDSYASLFAAAPKDAMCGESSTHYTKLPNYPHTVDRMHRHLPNGTRFIYIMRHPIERMVSQYIHEWTQHAVECPIDEAIDSFPALIDYSRYAMQLEPYINVFGRGNVLPVFFERLANHEQDELERICRFLSYKGAVRWDDSIGEKNASSQRLRKNPVRDAIVNLPVVKALRRAFVPQSVRDRIKDIWTMKERPELSPASIEQVTKVFDRDLAILGSSLGLELTCANFKQVAEHAVPQWCDNAKTKVVVG